jgi:hypothetical protein
VARAGGHAAEVFSETATDAVLAGDAPPPDQTEPAAGVPDTGSVISSHRGTTDGDRA